MFRLPTLAALVCVVPVLGAPVPKDPPRPTWPMFGGTPARNMVNLNEKLPAFPKNGPDWDEKEQVQAWENEWVLWKAKLGAGYSLTSSPVVAGGRVYIGTNNQQPRNKRDTEKHRDGQIEPIDKGILMVFDEKTGEFLWQAVHDKMPDGYVTDWPRIGVSSTPTIVGHNVYYVSNDALVVCADAGGFANGNQGFQNEQYKDATDVDILWKFDMRKELQVFPHCASNCSPLVVGDCVYVCTSNGVDQSHVKLPSPQAPSLICLDRHTGKLLWKDHSAGRDVMHGQWSSPAYAEEPVPQVIFGSGDGWLRGYDPATGKVLWKFDCNRKGAEYEVSGESDKLSFVAMPVVYEGRVYIGTGDDPEIGSGNGNLWCIDLKLAVELGAKATNHDVSSESLLRMEKQPDGTTKAETKPNPASALVWHFGGQEQRKWARRDFKFDRTLSTVAIADDILYATGIGGFVYCLNAKTGELYWEYDTRASIWGSPYLVDGKLIVVTEASELFFLQHKAKPGKYDFTELAKNAPNQRDARKIYRAEAAKFEKDNLLAKIELSHCVRSTPIVVNGVLFMTGGYGQHLYAIRSRK